MGRHALTQSEFIRRANIAHNNKYDYSETHYINSSTKVQVICPKHGIFSVEPTNHTHHWDQPYIPNKKPCGCGICGKEFTKGRNILGLLPPSIILSRFNAVHGARYDYSKSNYIGRNYEITIICSVHGEFQQKVCHHLSGCGCQQCKNSQGQNLITTWLDKHQITHYKEYKFINCVNIGTNRKLPFDFYIPEYNLVIEYDGEQHFHPVKFHRKMKTTQINELFEKTQQRDYIKNTFCVNSNIRMLRIPYTDKHNISKILTEYLAI